MSKNEELFPQISKSLSRLIEDEEGNIPGKKLLMLGTMMIVLSSFLSLDAFAAHRSNSSHRSHSSHRSSSGHGNHSNHSNHASHSNHGSHGSHESHVSHTSHSNTASHSNSLYSAEGDVTYHAPSVSKVPGVAVAPVQTTEDTFTLPIVEEAIEQPNATPTSTILPSLAVPATTPGTKIDAGNIHQPSATEEVK